MSPGPSILLIDDDAGFRERLARALTARGCRVVTAPDAAGALEAGEGGGVEGVVVDLRLQAGSGLGLIPALKARHPAARIVVLTGFGSLGTAVEAGRLGVIEYLTKPVDVDRLHEILTDGAGPERPGTAVSTEVPSLERVEWEHIQRVLSECGGNVSRTARLLGIDRRSLQRKLAKYPPNR